MQLAPDQAMGMFVNKLCDFVRSSMEDAVGQSLPPAAVVVPDTFNAAQRDVVRRACAIAGLPLEMLVSRRTAAAMVYGTRKPAETLAQVRRTLIVDVGAMYCTCSVYEWGSEEEEEEKGDNPKAGKCLAFESSPSLGSGAVDAVLFAELAQQCESKYKFSVEAGSKAGVRLMAQVVKLKKTLSGLPEASVTCESVGPDGQDASLTFTRAQLEAACGDYIKQVGELVTRVVSDAMATKAKGDAASGPDAKLELGGGIELIGGGTYTPWVQSAILEATNRALNTPAELRFTLDSMAAPAVGASFLLAKQHEPTGAVVRPVFESLATIATTSVEESYVNDPNSAAYQVFGVAEMEQVHEFEGVKVWTETEQRMQANDRDIQEMNSLRNKLEAFIFESKNIVSGGGSVKHSDLIDRDACTPVLDEAEQWMWDVDELTADSSLYAAKLDQVETALRGPMEAYHAAVDSEKKAKEEQLKHEADKAARERAEQGEQTDHDFRKLSKPDRMKKVMLNKDEGNSLFKDGNYEAASLRYIRALQHTSKFFDLSPGDVEEVDAVKVSLHLNSAQCFIKLKRWDDVIASCTKALEVDPENAKALYRRALALETTNEFDKAKKDIGIAKAALPDDKAIGRLAERIDAQIKRQLQKQKNMAMKMFG